MRASTGIKEAVQIVRITCLSKESGIHRDYISKGMTHVMNGGKPFYLSREQVDKLNIAIGRIAGMLKRTEIILDDAVLLQIKAMTKNIVAKYIFEDIMSKSHSWYQNRVTSPKLKFKQEDIDELNRAIHIAGENLESITLEYEQPRTMFADVYAEEEILLQESSLCD